MLNAYRIAKIKKLQEVNPDEWKNLHSRTLY
jgi:hypothetical protein